MYKFIPRENLHNFIIICFLYVFEITRSFQLILWRRTLFTFYSLFLLADCGNMVATVKNFIEA